MDQTKTNMKAIILAVIITAVVVGGGVYYFQKNAAEASGLSSSSIESYFITGVRNDELPKNANGMNKTPDELGLTAQTMVVVTCPDSAGTPCGGELFVLSKDPIRSGTQEFYLAYTMMPDRFTYFGPFTDDLQNLIRESKPIEYQPANRQEDSQETSDRKQEGVAEVESILQRLQQSLVRGDAELAPSYTEFYDDIYNIQKDLAEAVLKLK